MCIGVAGTGIGSRIISHLRYGGKELKERHRRYATVAMNSEHSTCFSHVVRPQVKIMVKGEMKTKSVQGSSISYNSNCSSYKLGSNAKNREVEATVNIALAGMTKLLTETPFLRYLLIPVNAKLGNQKTAFHQSQTPCDTQVAQVGRKLEFLAYDSHRII
jgi:hypothetical protein